MLEAPVREELSRPPGVRFTPQEPSGVGVLVLAGSRGAADEDRARLFADQGAIAESIQWFAGPDQHPGPWEIPLETFGARVESLAVDCDRVVLVGLSFGAEAALLTAAHSTQVDAVVAFSPSDVAWAGITEDGRQTSHWTLAGEPVPFVGFAAQWQPTTDPPSYRDLYLESRRLDPSAVEAATIAVERIPTLVQVVGGDDQVWPADLHADRIAARRARHGLPTTTISVAAAGHRAVLPGESVVATGVRMQRGGNETANRELGSLAWKEILDLLTP